MVVNTVRAHVPFESLLERESRTRPDCSSPPTAAAEIDEDGQPEPLLDTRWDFAEQCRRLIASKHYE